MIKNTFCFYIRYTVERRHAYALQCTRGPGQRNHSAQCWRGVAGPKKQKIYIWLIKKSPVNICYSIAKPKPHFLGEKNQKQKIAHSIKPLSSFQIDFKNCNKVTIITNFLVYFLLLFLNFSLLDSPALALALPGGAGRTRLPTGMSGRGSSPPTPCTATATGFPTR